MGVTSEVVASAIGAAILTTTALAVCVMIEIVSPRTHYRLSERLMGACFIVLMPVCAALIAPVLSYAWVSCFGRHVLLDLSWLPAPVLVVGILLYRDFLNYWQHRFDHFAFWPVHAVHHSQVELHAANGYGHPFQLFTEFLVITVPLSFVDTGHTMMPLWVTLIGSIQAMVIHSPLRLHLGPLRRVFNDSRFHRIHHSVEERHFGKNYATLFTLWDQMFGTAYFPKHDEWPEVGVMGLEPPRTPAQVLAYPLRLIKPIDAPTLSSRAL